MIKKLMIRATKLDSEKIIENEEKKPQTAKEYIEAAPDGVAEVLNAGVESLQREKEKLIATITANKQNS